jgi:hypothetical protein
MSLFQICYGPEIDSILNTIQNKPGIKKEVLIKNYQYFEQGDISSLVDAAINFLVELGFIQVQNSKEIWPIKFEGQVSRLDIIKRLSELSNETMDPVDPNYIFSSMYYRLFVTPNRLFIKDLYYETNLAYERLAISQEKINAWKRIMEYLGLGYRVYSGFYALPQYNLMKEVIKEIGKWEGPLHLFFERKIDPIIPCLTNGGIYNGITFSILNLGETGMFTLSKKQDLPYLSFGENSHWNWIQVGGDYIDSLHIS